jgi:hypothetical protein
MVSSAKPYCNIKNDKESNSFINFNLFRQCIQTEALMSNTIKAYQYAQKQCSISGNIPKQFQGCILPDGNQIAIG